jgi:hypothetical protein
MVWRLFNNSYKRRAISRKSLESAVAEAVKSSSDCATFVGVIIQRQARKSRSDTNWAIRGVRFGKADREKSGKVLAVVVERMQREFSLFDDEDDGRKSKRPKLEVLQIPRDEEVVSVSEHD